MGNHCGKSGARNNVINPPTRKKTVQREIEGFPINNAPTAIEKISIKARYNNEIRIVHGTNLDEIKMSVSKKFKLQHDSFSVVLLYHGMELLLTDENDLFELRKQNIDKNAYEIIVTLDVNESVQTEHLLGDG